jgi:hypothetical protein
MHSCIAKRADFLPFQKYFDLMVQIVTQEIKNSKHVGGLYTSSVNYLVNFMSIRYSSTIVNVYKSI